MSDSEDFNKKVDALSLDSLLGRKSKAAAAPAKPVELAIPPELEGKVFVVELARGDSLESLSLRHGAPIAEIKRVNHISSPHELYARRALFIPRESVTKLTPGVQGLSAAEAFEVRRLIEATGCAQDQAVLFLRGNNWNYSKAKKAIKSANSHNDDQIRSLLHKGTTPSSEYGSFSHDVDDNLFNL